jgi:hypothetical protein
MPLCRAPGGITAPGAGRDGLLRLGLTLACLGIGTAQMWWFTALVVAVLIFAAAETGAVRTTRPKAIFLVRHQPR